MNDSHSNGPQNSPKFSASEDTGFTPWKRLKTKRISYLTLPLLVMATLTEFVILATGWKYQQVVCLPQGMGVTFFGIGPIGATILAVELLKLPLAIWTASRHGWQKTVMVLCGLPLICVLTFQLVKDMAVYEMGVALTPATQMLEKATAEDTKAKQLEGELAAIEQKKADRELKVKDLAAKEVQAKTDLQDSLKRNDDIRHDAVSLTDYQRKELAEVDNRESAIIVQFNTDTAQLTKQLADLHASREIEVGRAAKWNAEDARIENAYKEKMADYKNQKAAYDKAKVEYDNAGFVKRQLLKEPVSPGVAPEREANTILKPTALAELDVQIATKEAELQSVNNKRRDRVAQVEADARGIREQFDHRSITKREEADKKRDELAAAEVALSAEWKAERKQIDEELAASVKKVDGIHAELDVARKNAEGYYEAREAAIRKTQVHRIATTVEIVRGLIKGERPMSIKMNAKERGDILTDQISMVRIWVYPVLALIVAFLPTLMVEIGFSTVFQPEQQREAHRFGFLGRHLHAVEVRAGRQKILNAERTAKESVIEIARREKTVMAGKLATEQALAERGIELEAANEALVAANAQHEEQLQQQHADYAEQAKKKEEEWVAKLGSIADTLTRTVVEKDGLRDHQKAEVERQVQARQKLWSDRIARVQQELDEHRATAEAERVTMMEEHHKRLTAVTEDCKTQLIQVRRQMSDAEIANTERSSRLSQELKETTRARDIAEAQLKNQTEALSLKLAQTQEGSARELEKATRQEKHRLEWQQLEFEKKMRQREDALEEQLKQREQELSFAFDARLAEERSKMEEEARQREADRGRQLEARTQETSSYWNEEMQRREEAAQMKLKQREQQLQTQAEAKLREAQALAEQRARERELEYDRQLEAKLRDTEARLREELQQKDGRFKQREAELAAKAEVQWTLEMQRRDESAQAKLKQREAQLQLQAEARLREAKAEADERVQNSQAEFDRQLEVKVRDTEARLREELQQKDAGLSARLKQREEELAARAEAHWALETQKREEAAQTKLKQREQQWLAQTEAKLRDAQADAEERGRSRQAEFERQLEAQSRAGESRLREELQQKEVYFSAKLKQREQELAARAETRAAELQKHWAEELQTREQDLEHRAEARVSAAESRLKDELEQKEELFQNKTRQRDQQWQAKLDSVQHQFQAQSEEALRRRSLEADSALRTLEAQMLEEMQQKEAAAQSRSKQREQEVIGQVRAIWDAESEAKMFAAMESFKGLLARTEKERDDAKQSAIDSARQLENVERKLSEASSFFSTWKNG